MDDIFCVTDRENCILQTLKSFNEAHPSLKFTVEVETDNLLEFLDVAVTRMQVKDKLPKLTSSTIIYSFKCVCGACYIGRTLRRLSQRVKEHHPRWLSQGKTGCISSAIVGHLVDTGHKIEQEKAFDIVYRIPLNRLKVARVRTLAMAEAIVIGLLGPNLYALKRLVQVLQLPWPGVKTKTEHDPAGERSHQLIR
ncbi:unnamed protein product [Echinostoma caproni]|uniref:Reverse transcriptase domain-containing protein n=1 Tax=Echinostoma caproni TaxID=27848 RepID=A0A183B5H2_9TREM|nr:unnamed protein product [Echinostoma caproni]